MQKPESFLNKPALDSKNRLNSPNLHSLFFLDKASHGVVFESPERIPDALLQRLNNDLNNFLTPPKQTVLERLRNLINPGSAQPAMENRVDTRKKVLQLLFEYDSYKVDQELRRLFYNKEKFSELLQHPLFATIVEFLLYFPEHFSFQLAYMMQYLQPEVVEKITQDLQPKTTTQDITVLPSYESHYNCAESEGLLLKAISREKFTILVDDDNEPLIVFKQVKMHIGLVLRSFITSNGQVVPKGAWVQPVTAEVKTLLKFENTPHLTQLPLHTVSGEWTYLRGLFSSYSAFEKFSKEEKDSYLVDVSSKIELALTLIKNNTYEQLLS